MPGQGRLGDKAHVALDAHGCPACPHPGIGPAIRGSSDVNVNRRPALRIDDPGVHAACCGTNQWTAAQGSLTVFINGKAAHRMGDQTKHCGGVGKLVEGSPNVIVGESSSAGTAVASQPAAARARGGAASTGTTSSAASTGTTSSAASTGTTSAASTGTTSSAAGTGTTSNAAASTPSGSPSPPPSPPPSASSPAPIADPEIDPDPATIGVEAQTAVLRAAAELHVPFCEECERLHARSQS